MVQICEYFHLKKQKVLYKISLSHRNQSFKGTEDSSTMQQIPRQPYLLEKKLEMSDNEMFQDWE